MKAATCIFLLAVLVMGTFAFSGYMFDSYQHTLDDNTQQKEEIERLQNQLKTFDNKNKDLESQVIQFKNDLNEKQKKLDEQTTITKQVQTALEQSKIQELEYQKKITTLDNEWKAAQNALEKTKIDLQTATVTLNQNNIQREQIGVALQETVADRNQCSEQVKKLQDAVAMATNIQENGLVPAGIFSAIILIGLIVWGTKTLKTLPLQMQSPSGRSLKTQRRQVKLVMNEQTYREFQDYLKNK